MHKNQLFETVLSNPPDKGADSLFIVSGYASAAMALHHLQAIRAAEKNISVRLIVGMCPQDGIAESNHKAFQQLMLEQFPKNFECSYVIAPPGVHSKIYAWFNGENPVCGFVGSANYSQNAFRGRQLEVMEKSDPSECRAYYESLLRDSMYCTCEEIQDSITIFDDLEFARRRAGVKAGIKQVEATPVDRYAGLPSIEVSLLDNNNKLPQASGLNWGQREGREPNQAYIRLSSPVISSDFFPERAAQFTVLTDDGKVLICTRAQDNGKAIETPQNNSLIGEYFRHRLSLPNGARVSKSDLDRYGRTSVRFFKIDDETYIMDFSNSGERPPVLRPNS